MVFLIPDADIERALNRSAASGKHRRLLFTDVVQPPRHQIGQQHGQYPAETPLMDAAFGAASSERFKARLERSKLNSASGPVAEQYDQFYRDHMMLVALFRVLAVMPIERSAPGRITFSWHSTATRYALMFWVLATGVVCIVGAERISLLMQTRAFDDYVYGIVFVLFLVPHFWIPFVGWGVAGQVAVYKTSWGAFQVRFYRVTGRTLDFPGLKRKIAVIAGACFACAVLFLLALTMLLEGFLLWHTCAYYHVMMMINMNCALWYINCWAIERASNMLSQHFRDDVRLECNALLVEQYRFLWLNLSELLQALGNAYARTYSTYCLFMFVNITIALYALISEVIDHGFSFSTKQTGLLVDAVYCSMLLFIFCKCSHQATRTVALGVQDTLLSIDLMRCDQPTQKEIDHFILAIEMNPAVVSLKGYANANLELLISSITKIAIYLIVLLQFKLSLVAQQQTPSMIASAVNNKDVVGTAAAAAVPSGTMIV